jgi:hypothetical protein
MTPVSDWEARVCRSTLLLRVDFRRLRRSDAALQPQAQFTESEIKSRVSRPQPESSGIRRTTRYFGQYALLQENVKRDKEVRSVPFESVHQWRQI